MKRTTWRKPMRDIVAFALRRQRLTRVQARELAHAMLKRVVSARSPPRRRYPGAPAIPAALGTGVA